MLNKKVVVFFFHIYVLFIHYSIFPYVWVVVVVVFYLFAVVYHKIIVYFVISNKLCILTTVFCVCFESFYRSPHLSSCLIVYIKRGIRMCWLSNKIAMTWRMQNEMHFTKYIYIINTVFILIYRFYRWINSCV